MTKSAMLKQYVVCDEYINHQDGYYTVHANTDCSLIRFKVLADFDTCEEAVDYIKYLRHPEEFFGADD